MQVKIKKVHPDAVIPAYATTGAACFDFTFIGKPLYDYLGNATLRTGLSFEIPEGFVMMVYSRSGHGFKYGVSLVNGTGVIDSDYRGEVMVKLHADGVDGQAFLDTINPGERIAQAMIIPVPQVQFVEGELSETERGNGGFGSTGK